MVGHPTVLRGAAFAGRGGAPVILQRTDQELVAAVLDQLGREDGRRELQRTSLAATREKDGTLKLFQPVHRTFHLALLEAACDQPGQPRLDPQKIESAGLVIRRVGRSGALEGWMQAGRKLRGWLPFVPGAQNADPDPARRRPALRAGHPEIDRRLALLGAAGEPAQESVVPLFVAPPEVCKAAGKTFLYGLISLTSAERSEAPAPPRPLDADLVAGQLSILLKNAARNTGYSWLGKTLTAASKADAGGLKKDFETLMACLQQLHSQLDAFDGADRTLRNLLDKVALPFGKSTKPAGQVLAEAAEVLLFRSDKPSSVKMPDAWPAIPAAQRQGLVEAARTAMSRRLAELVAGEGRFDRPDRRYRVQAFVRVKSDPGCPPRLVWSEPSEPFVIAPWFDAGAAPPVRVSLPDFRDRSALRKLKPNVAFVLPDGLKELIDGSDLKKLMDGEGGSGIGLRWICGFNIPLITLCAFFVLNIFLVLLNLVFFWLPFIKICIPFPTKSED